MGGDDSQSSRGNSSEGGNDERRVGTKRDRSSSEEFSGGSNSSSRAEANPPTDKRRRLNNLNALLKCSFGRDPSEHSGEYIEPSREYREELCQFIQDKNLTIDQINSLLQAFNFFVKSDHFNPVTININGNCAVIFKQTLDRLNLLLKKDFQGFNIAINQQNQYIAYLLRNTSKIAEGLLNKNRSSLDRGFIKNTTINSLLKAFVISDSGIRNEQFISMIISDIGHLATNQGLGGAVDVVHLLPLIDKIAKGKPTGQNIGMVIGGLGHLAANQGLGGAIKIKCLLPLINKIAEGKPTEQSIGMVIGGLRHLVANQGLSGALTVNNLNFFIRYLDNNPFPKRFLAYLLSLSSMDNEVTSDSTYLPDLIEKMWPENAYLEPLSAVLLLNVSMKFKSILAPEVWKEYGVRAESVLCNTHQCLPPNRLNQYQADKLLFKAYLDQDFSSPTPMEDVEEIHSLDTPPASMFIEDDEEIYDSVAPSAPASIERLTSGNTGTMSDRPGVIVNQRNVRRTADLHEMRERARNAN